MILTGRSIRKRTGMITPFREAYKHESGMSGGLTCAGYDVHLAQDAVLYPRKMLMGSRSHVLLSTVEHFDIPLDLTMQIKNKSTWARRWLDVSRSTTAEPGWRGHLTLEAVYDGDVILRIAKGTPIAQAVFIMLDGEADSYSGKYQDQPNEPTGAK